MLDSISLFFTIFAVRVEACTFFLAQGVGEVLVFFILDDPSYLASLFGGVVVHPLTSSGVIALVLALFCLVASAYFSGSEVAFFSLGPKELEELKESERKRDQQILDLLSRSDYLLGTILVGNNFFNIAITMLVSYVVGETMDFQDNHTLGFLVQVLGITSVVLFFGEILPKVYFQNHALQSSRMAVGVMSLLERVSRPITKGLVALGNGVSRGFKRQNTTVTPEELEKAIELTTDRAEEKGLLNEIVRFYQKSVSEVMTPRMDVAALEYQTPYSEVKAFIIEKGYSRMPVYDDRIDNIRGVLYAKDLLPYLSEEDSFEWQRMIREAFFVPESKRINSLLEDFREQKIHMAIVVDEFGGTSGVVTMEDLLEEIVGEIEDEYDEEERLYEVQPDGSIIFDAKISILDFLRITKLEEITEITEQMDEADTLGGLLLEKKGDFPQVGEVIILDGYPFKIIAMGRRRISKVLFTNHPIVKVADAEGREPKP